MEARVGIDVLTSITALKILGFFELHKPTLSLHFQAFSYSVADTFADSGSLLAERLAW